MQAQVEVKGFVLMVTTPSCQLWQCQPVSVQMSSVVAHVKSREGVSIICTTQEILNRLLPNVIYQQLIRRILVAILHQRVMQAGKHSNISTLRVLDKGIHLHFKLIYDLYSNFISFC